MKTQLTACAKLTSMALWLWLCAALLLPLAAHAHEACEDGTSLTRVAQADVAPPAQRVAITAKAGRFEPDRVRLVQGAPAVLEFTRVVDSACMNAVRMPWMSEAVPLPMHEKVEIAVDTSHTGIFSYGCWMDMVFGDVIIDKAEKANPAASRDGRGAGELIAAPPPLAQYEGDVRTASGSVRQAPLDRPAGGRAWSQHIPNVVLTTHRGESVKFYDDLIKDKVVVINFMYTTCTDT